MELLAVHMKRMSDNHNPHNQDSNPATVPLGGPLESSLASLFLERRRESRSTSSFPLFLRLCPLLRNVILKIKTGQRRRLSCSTKARSMFCWRRRPRKFTLNNAGTAGCGFVMKNDELLPYVSRPVPSEVREGCQYLAFEHQLPDRVTRWTFFRNFRLITSLHYLDVEGDHHAVRHPFHTRAASGTDRCSIRSPGSACALRGSEVCAVNCSIEVSWNMWAKRMLAGRCWTRFGARLLW